MKQQPKTLYLHEQLLLLALDDAKGSVVFSSSTALPYALAGALILEMLDRGQLALVENTLAVVDTGRGDPLIDEALTLVRESKKPRPIQYWVERFPNKLKGFRNRIAESLVEKGILRNEKKSFLWVFEFSRFPEVDAWPEQAILKKLRSAVLGDGVVDEETVKLLSLVKAAELIGEVFGRGERREAKKRIKELTSKEQVGKAVSEAVAATNAAVMAAVTASVAASSAATSGS